MKFSLWVFLIVAQVALFCFAAPLGVFPEHDDDVEVSGLVLASGKEQEEGPGATVSDLNPRQNIPNLYGSSTRPQAYQVEQGAVGNCWLVAAIKTTAKLQHTTLERMMEYDETRAAVTVTVPPDPRNDMSIPTRITIRYKDIKDRKNLIDIPADGAWWPRALVAAVSRARQVNCNSGYPIERGLELLLGKTVTLKKISRKVTEEELHVALSPALSKKRLVLVGTKKGKSGFNEPIKKRFLVAEHSYGVIKYNALQKTVTLLNPWPVEKDKKTGRVLIPIEKVYAISELVGLLDGVAVWTRLPESQLRRP